MTNATAYANGILNRALDPTSQPADIQAFFATERTWLLDQVPQGSRLADFGCGTGRHLGWLAPRLALGIGLDYMPAHIVQARTAHRHACLRFVVADAQGSPFQPGFDLAICLFNTWGTMPNKAAVLAEMQRLSPQPRSRLLTVYSEHSVSARRQWYASLGDQVIEETDGYLRTAAGFRTEHFTEQRLRRIIGDCQITPLCDIAYAVHA